MGKVIIVFLFHSKIASGMAPVAAFAGQHMSLRSDPDFPWN